MSRPIWFVNFLKKIYPTRHSLARLTRLPVIGELVDYFVFRGDDMIFIPKTQTININASLDPPESILIPYQIVEHFINQAEYHWIMDSCICRESENCQGYPQKLGCLFLGKPVLGINPDLGRRVTKEQALEHTRRCREAGLIHSIGQNRLDAIWLGISPIEELMTICNCCPCCCLWGIIPDLTPKISQKLTIMPGVSVEVTEKCQGCGDCGDDVCFAKAILVNNGRAEISAECRGCGRCVEVCPEDAILLTLNGEEDIKAAIKRLDKLVNN
jgi:ferredoxin